MKLLDRYVIGKFLFVLLFSLLAFVSIYVFGDIMEHLDRFADKGASIALIAKYYLFYIPYMIVIVLPIAMLLASLFSIGQLAKHHELTAMRASGISLYRTLAPLLILSLMISALALLWSEYAVPYCNARKADIYKHDIRKKTRERRIVKRDVFIQDEQGNVFFFKTFDSRKKVGSLISISTYFDNRLVTRIDAERIQYHNNYWTLYTVFMRRFEHTDEIATELDSLRLPTTSLLPADVLKKKKHPDEMNYFELKKHIARLYRSGQDASKWLVDLHLKLAFPLANFIIVLFGAPLMANQKRSGGTMGFGISIFICFVFFGIIRASQALGYNGNLSPLLAAWLGNGIFGITAFIVLLRVRK